METSMDYFYRYIVVIFTDWIFSIVNFLSIYWQKYVGGIFRGNPSWNEEIKKSKQFDNV